MFRRIFLGVLGASLVLSLGACRPSLQAENKRLEAELEQTKRELAELQRENPAEKLFRTANDSFDKGDYQNAKMACEHIVAEYPDSAAAKKSAELLAKMETAHNTPNAPDLDLTINELWTQRFEDKLRFRAQQRLDDKMIRITGAVENISETSLSIAGTKNQIGPVNMMVNLNDSYAKKIQAGLASLEPETPVTVQGRFSFDKMGLRDAVLVNRTTGKILFSDELKALSKKEDLSSPGTGQGHPTVPAQ